MNYRRSRLAGGTYFFTVVTVNRSPIFEIPAAVQRLRTTFRSVMNRHPFAIDAIVIMPDHLHCIWTLPNGDSDYSTRWRLVKTSLTKRLKEGHMSKDKKSQSLWQKRYWEHTIRNQQDFNRHVDYIHFNPVKHGYVTRAADYDFA